MYGAYCYDKAKEKVGKMNTKLFEMRCDDTNNMFTKEKSSSFKDFLV